MKETKGAHYIWIGFMSIGSWLSTSLTKCIDGIIVKNLR